MRNKLVLFALSAAILLFCPRLARADTYTEELLQLLNDYPVSEEELEIAVEEEDTSYEETAPSEETAEIQDTSEESEDISETEELDTDQDADQSVNAAEEEENTPAMLGLTPEEETEMDEDEAEAEEEETALDPEFMTGRLIVMDVLPADTYGAVAIVSRNDTQHILQYETQEEARDAYEMLTAEGYQLMPDEVITAEFDSVAPTKKSGLLSYGPSMMGLDYLAGALNQTGAGREVTIADIDSGVNTSSSYLKGRLKSGYHIFTYDGYNYFGNSDVTDYNGHGTNVAGVIVESTSNNVKIYPIKAFTDDGYSTVTAIDLAIGLAADNADVINMSFTYTDLSSLEQSYLNSAIDAALADGDIICCAAGNYNAAVKKYYPACYEPVWTISSVNSSKKRSSFSNHGKLLDFAAPGEGIYVLNRSDGTDIGNGTSFSSPFEASAAAMFLSVGYKRDEIYQMFRSLSDDLGSSGKDNSFGYGLLTLTKSNVCACGQANCPVILMDGEECDCGVCKVSSRVSISKAKFSKVGYKIYNGKTKKPSVKVTYKGKTLTKGRHYTVSYQNNTKIGTASIVIKGKGSYKGSKTIEFKIRPRRGTVKKLIRRSSTSVQVNIHAIKGVKKFRIRYSVHKNMKNAVKLNTTNRKKIVKGLKKGKTYYIQVRGYKKVNGKNYYGRWSKKAKINL